MLFRLIWIYINIIKTERVRYYIVGRMWSRHSFKNFKRYIDYFHHHDAVFQHIEKLPPIVHHTRIEELKDELRQCQNKERLVLHTGDCAQPFEHIDHHILQKKIHFLKELKQLVQTNSKKTTLIGRIAGQYAKPRSSEFTTHNGKQIHNYKGDNVNGLLQDDREPDVSKLRQGYFNSVVTNNYINNNMPSLYISHEGLILPYEAALTKTVGHHNYCLSAHMIWIGERTRQLDGAHVEFFRGISNPVGVKVSSNIKDDQFVQLIHILNPRNEQGKLMIIVRMGAHNIGSKLQHLIDLKIKHHLNFLFISDPMHANTYESKSAKVKTRHYNHILSEVNSFKDLMTKNSLPFGLSLESTHEQVTECVGGAHPFHEQELKPQTYKSKCDPRLNPAQIKKLLHEVGFR